jgi:hypothetical protein
LPPAVVIPDVLSAAMDDALGSPLHPLLWAAFPRVA